MSHQWHEVGVFGEDDDVEMVVTHIHPEDPFTCDLSLYLANNDWDDLIEAGPGNYLVRIDDEGELDMFELESASDEDEPEVIDLTEGTS